ncbi:unnamed protein product [Owenia fusiformis]|uniref:Uncharacterized protein n=1 Tax=Owenia fusiformis TaxID=6347 RepID=A0A8J1TSW3_OWEFU|nr:unnamed protein product [Owenia fusiformis]
MANFRMAKKYQNVIVFVVIAVAVLYFIIPNVYKSEDAIEVDQSIKTRLRQKASQFDDVVKQYKNISQETLHSKGNASVLRITKPQSLYLSTYLRIGTIEENWIKIREGHFEVKNNEGTCTCTFGTCKCCIHFMVKKLKINSVVCAVFSKTTMLDVVLLYNDAPVLHEQRPAKESMPVCIHQADSGAELCAVFHKLQMHPFQDQSYSLGGCLNFQLVVMQKEKLVFPSGCFDLSQ